MASVTDCVPEMLHKASHPTCSLHFGPAPLPQEGESVSPPSVWAVSAPINNVVPFLRTVLSHLGHQLPVPQNPDTCVHLPTQRPPLQEAQATWRPGRMRGCRKREAKEHWVARHGGQAVILEVDPQAPAVPMWIRKELHCWTLGKFHKIRSKINHCFKRTSFGKVYYIVLAVLEK